MIEGTLDDLKVQSTRNRSGCLVLRPPMQAKGRENKEGAGRGGRARNDGVAVADFQTARTGKRHGEVDM